MAASIFSSTTSTDQEKFLAAKLLEIAMFRLVCMGVCDKIQQPDGTGLTANFVRYQRMNVPVSPLSEGVAPSSSSFSLQTQTVTMDQWGDLITITDVSQLTTKHPLLDQCIRLLADNAQRVIDREIQLVWLAGTNVIYGDGSVLVRTGITSSMKMSDTLIHKAVTTLVDAGAPARGGPASTDFMLESAVSASSSINKGQKYVGIAGTHVIHDIMQTSTSLGTFISVAMYANQEAAYNAEVGEWLGVRWVESNFIPKFVTLGNTTAAVTTGNAGGTGTPTITITNSGGSLTSGTYFWKVTRKDVTRGFEEAISIAHSSVVTGSSQIAFAFPATAGFVYNLYFDATAGGGTSADSNLLLVQANIAPSATVTVLSVPASGANPPASVTVAGTAGVTTVNPVYLHGEASCNWVGLQNLQTYVTPDVAIIGNELRQLRAVGYKFLGKAMIRNQTRLLRLEVASSYN